MIRVIWAAVLLLIVLDITGIFRFTAKYGAAFLLIFAPHILIVRRLLMLYGYGFAEAPVTVILIYTLLRFNLLPTKLRKTSSFRLNVLFGGKRLLNLGIYSVLIQIPLYIVYLSIFGIGGTTFAVDAVITFLIVNIIIYNGMFRVICSSKWLNVLKRLICIFFIWVPVLNIAILLFLRHTAAKEYDYFEYKLNDMPRRIENQTCRTKYPIMLVHGVGFRDTRFFNYWGRIPKQLRKMGADIHYGNQEGWATVENNADLLNGRVKEILAQTGAEKINIIAHSKGGLDCRLMISKYNLDCVASLTTMGTPHRGVKFADMLLGIIPDKIVDKVSDFVNKIFYKYGDKMPDFKSVAYSFTEKEMIGFNAKVKDSPHTYYQSWDSVMRNPFSDWILTIPYIIGRIAGSKQNDGLVPEPSAHWGNFRGTIKSKCLHGVSHGDLIDLKREDFRGFDMLQKYVDIVEELKGMGF